jgi:hypothetical protein
MIGDSYETVSAGSLWRDVCYCRRILNTGILRRIQDINLRTMVKVGPCLIPKNKWEIGVNYRSNNAALPGRGVIYIELSRLRGVTVDGVWIGELIY